MTLVKTSVDRSRIVNRIDRGELSSSPKGRRYIHILFRRETSFGINERNLYS